MHYLVIFSSGDVWVLSRCTIDMLFVQVFLVQVALSVYGRKARDTSDKIHQVTDFGDRLLKHACPSEILLFKKPIETQLHQLVANMPALNVADITELEFIANFQAIQAPESRISSDTSKPSRRWTVLYGSHQFVLLLVCLRRKVDWLAPIRLLP